MSSAAVVRKGVGERGVALPLLYREAAHLPNGMLNFYFEMTRQL